MVGRVHSKLEVVGSNPLNAAHVHIRAKNRSWELLGKIQIFLLAFISGWNFFFENLEPARNRELFFSICTGSYNGASLPLELCASIQTGTDASSQPAPMPSSQLCCNVISLPSIQ
jgi:hypothetical protein